MTDLCAWPSFVFCGGGGGGGGGGVISRMIIYGPTESMWGCHCGRHDSELNTELFVDLFLLGSQF